MEREAEKQAKEFFEKLKQKFVDNRNEQKLSFLLMGRTGVGKSSTINFLMGREIAPVNDYEPCTMEVKGYEDNVNGIEIVVYDTPGLCDDLEDKGNDYQYLELMRSQVKKVNSMWFVSRLDDTRVSNDEKRGIKLISECFSPKIWQQAIIVFTFAGNVSREKYSERLQKRTELIRKEISEYAGVQIANKIPSVPIDNEKKCNPDGEDGLGKLFTQIYCRLSEEDALPFLMSTVNRIETPSKEPRVIHHYHTEYVENHTRYNDKQSTVTPKETDSNPYNVPILLNKSNTDKVRERTEVILNSIARGAVTGSSIGAAIGRMGGPGGTLVGAAVGGVVGAAVGFFGSLFSGKK